MRLPHTIVRAVHVYSALHSSVNSPTAGSYVALTFSSSLSHIVRNGLIAFELNFGRDHYCGFCVSKVFGFSPLGLTLFSSSLSEVLSPAGSDGFDASLQKYFRATFLTIFLVILFCHLKLATILSVKVLFLHPIELNLSLKQSGRRKKSACNIFYLKNIHICRQPLFKIVNDRF